MAQISKTTRWRLSMLILGLAACAFCRFYLQYPWQLALLTSFALIALGYSARRTYYEQRRLYRAEPSWEFGEADEESSAAEESTATDNSTSETSP